MEHFGHNNPTKFHKWVSWVTTIQITVPLGDWLEKKKVPAIIIKQQFGFPMSTT